MCTVCLLTANMSCFGGQISGTVCINYFCLEKSIYDQITVFLNLHEFIIEANNVVVGSVYVKG